jgi:hypothetical protein
MYEEEQKCIQDFGGETYLKGATWKTQAYRKDKAEIGLCINRMGPPELE